MTKLTALFLISLFATPALSSEPVTFTINTKKWSHVLDDHFISITVNPTDLLQGKVYGLAMNSTMAILKGLAPAYVRIGSMDTGKYIFKRNRYPSDLVKPDDEYTVTETHWMVFNEVTQQAGLDVIVCLNAAHRSEGTKKWDPRNSLELISFSDSQGYNLTWQLGYEVQGGEDLSGLQYGKDLNRLRTILNAFPRYQHAKLIGPDIRVIHKKEDVDFWNDVLSEAGPILDAVTWHPRWPQPSKMKVSDNSDLGYEFPVDYLEPDKAQLSKILQKSTFKNPVWIGETKRESTGTFAEGLIWARRLLLAAKLGIEVVMKQPNLMDVSHPKPEYWIALLHKKLLGKSVLETRSVTNVTDLAVISHCTHPYYWVDKPEKLQDGPVTIYAVNMGGLEQKIQIKGTSPGKSQLVFQYVLTSGSDPDSVFSQMTYLNGEPIMMSDDGMLPDIIPKIRKMERGIVLKLPPYSVGYWVIPEAKVKICQVQPHSIPMMNIETLTPSHALKSTQKTLENIRDINQFLVEKLKNPESESEEVQEVKIEVESSESSEKDVSLTKENALPRVARRIREVRNLDQINDEIKTIMEETQELFSKSDNSQPLNTKTKLPKSSQTMEKRIQNLAEGISQAIKSTNQQQEFNKFLEDSGLKQDFGSLLVNERKYNGMFEKRAAKERLKRSISTSEEYAQEESIEDETELPTPKGLKFGPKISLVADDEDEKNRKQDLVIPHQPDLKGLEERYKFIVHSKIQDGKRKIDDIKRKIKDEAEAAPKMKSPESVNGLQEEIIKKEIELLEKTEETVADILKSQKKRQETFEDIIFDELSDVKEERIRELQEMHRNQKKKDNAIVKRQTQGSLSRPLLKTVEYIEKNFNLEPESVRKIKRSLEEKMGDFLRNYDTKKSLEVKKRMAPTREERKSLRKISKDEVHSEKSKTDGRDVKNETSEEPLRRKAASRKTSTNTQTHHKSVRKSEETRRPKESKKKVELDYDDSFELFNNEKLDTEKKLDKTRPTGTEEKRSGKKISIKFSEKEEKPREETRTENETPKKEEEKKETPKAAEVKEEPKNEEPKNKESKNEIVEERLLKNDKERRERMLKEIIVMVDQLNSKEKGDERTKRMNEEDISEEFETDRKFRKINRKPRRAEMEEQVAHSGEGSMVQERSKAPVTEVPVTEAPLPATKTATTTAAATTTAPTTTAPTTTTAQTTTTTGKRTKHRKRVRPSRRQKEQKKQPTEEEKESTQRKRHLTGFDRPVFEMEKKKLIKPKLRKLNPKFLHYGNELLPDEKTEKTEMSTQKEEKPTDRTTTQMPIVDPNEELKRDLEEIIEEKIFLGQGSGTSNEKSETNGKTFTEVEGTETTESPTESYIIVEPTEETDEERTEKPQVVKPAVNEEEGKSGKAPEPENVEKISREVVKDKNDIVQVAKFEEQSSEEDNKSSGEMSERSEELDEAEDAFSFEEDLMKEEKQTETKTSSKVMRNTGIPEESKTEEPIEDVTSRQFAGVDNSQRKRRATFVPNHGEDEEDYSSEERIEKFKQMIYRKSPTKKPLKNEVVARTGSGMGVGADEFLRMAGSTMRVMFDDVIPEAYGQTKNKIQNMGIPEYIKEFGKIVQQMKNLDQIFLNIGEAAVKGYIKGNKAEKGPYIQVISRKKRSVKDAIDAETETPDESVSEGDPTGAETDAVMSEDETTEGSSEYATTTTSKTVTAVGQLGDREDTRDVSTLGGSSGEVVHENDKTGSLETTTSVNNLQTEETTKALVLTPVPYPQPTDVQKKSEKADLKKLLKSKMTTLQVPEDIQERIFTPWIKTTKDFIQQAITTLQRQKELSEILANDLMRRGETEKQVGKREVNEDEPKLPVYHMVRPSNRKRDTQQSDENLIRHLRGLQPGVYVVPSEEMTNIRSEQITNEAKQKSGMPNVVTLNIYYDKKNGVVAKDTTATTTTGQDQNVVTYYHNKWDQNNQYVVPDVNIPAPVSTVVNPAFQTQAVYTAEPRVAELPNSRLVQYPTSSYHYPPIQQKIYPSIVPNPQTVYNPLYYLPPENRYIPQAPGTKRQWREFRARSAGLPVISNYNTGWNIQYDVPGRSSAKSVIPSSYNKHYKLLTQDKKRSIDQIDPTWSETALPFWKFFTTDEKKNKLESGEKVEGVESESSEDVFEENRKRAKANKEKKVKESEEEVQEEEIHEEKPEEKSRKRRSLSENPQSELSGARKAKRSHSYQVDFKDHDILPEWFGTYQEIDNGLDQLPPHARRSHIVSVPWTENDEELLSILDADDELPLVDLDSDDYYYSNDNTVHHLRRYRRSTDQLENNMIKSNMIYKMPMDGDHVKPKGLGMSGIKKLTDEDSSLELMTKSNLVAVSPIPKKPLEVVAPPPQQQPAPHPITQSPFQVPTTQSLGVLTLQPLNKTALLPRNPHDDTFYYFFKYAYDSFVKVMKSMTELF